MVAAFLFTSGVIRNNRLLLRVSLAVAFLYGGIVWWMLPIDDHVSWEGHLSGAVVGTLLAVAFKRQGPQDPVYNFEREDPMPPCQSGGWPRTPTIPTPSHKGLQRLMGIRKRQMGLQARQAQARAPCPPLSRLRRRPATRLNC